MFACFSIGRGSLTIVRKEQRVGPDLSAALMLKSLLALLLCSLTPACKGAGQRVASLLPFSAVLYQRLGCRGKIDEEARITIPHESFHELVLFLQALSLLRNTPGTVVKTPYHILIPEMQVPVSVRLFKVYSNVELTILPSYIRIKEGERPTLLHLHGKFYGWAYAV